MSPDRHIEEARASLSRRRFLKITGTTVALATMGSLLDWVPGQQASANPVPLTNHPRVVVVNLRGGNDGLNTVVPIASTRYYDRRPTLGIPASTALPLSGSTLYGLHPNLTQLQSRYNSSGDLAILLNVGYENANLSHFVSEDIWSYGVRGAFQGLGVPAFSGWIARFADLYANSPMGVVSIGQRNLKDFQGGQVAVPLQVDRLDRFRFDNERIRQYRDNHEYRLSIAQQTLAQSSSSGLVGEVVDAANQAHDLSGQIQAARDYYENTYATTTTADYGTGRLGRRLRDVATLIQGGFDTRLYYTGFNGFDTHGGQAGRHNDLMEQLDRALGAFATDLETMGVWNDTIVVVISEFGRRNFENGSAGTDHGHGNHLLVLGGQVQGGVYGPDVTDTMIDERFLDYEIDFRTVYEQILQRQFGVDVARIFPEPKVKTASPGVFLS